MRRALAQLIAASAILALSSPSAAAPDGKNRKITVENLSGQVVRELYASPVTAKTWEEDLLGQKTLASGTSINANIDNGTSECRYDLKAVRADGREYTHRDVNVCAASKWMLREESETIQ
ncbi:hypothetical protein E2493_15700 [Sphingomonas parva]|uniref:Surface antigen domain-containing protein n=1 Tax=Sphingomonas parva TaxID=2555898 RepID=A0A4Y8ZR58_9SPHN|nr:hypothetical protein [Sphingomonas parva]TFI57309.1 hypothetical protein E2493_15700 [Sphingomonas parva]